MEFFDDLECFISERMQRPLIKLFKNEQFCRKKKDYDLLYNEIYCKISQFDDELKNKLEDLIVENDNIHSTYEILYFIIGFLDGIKFYNKFD